MHSCKHVLTNAELMQQVIHEDFKHVIEKMREFRSEHYDNLLATQNNKAIVGAKSALSRRWIVFFQNMLHLGIFSLNSAEWQLPRLSKLILASHLSMDRNAAIFGATGSHVEEQDDGAADNLSMNSDPEPIVELAGNSGSGTAEEGKNHQHNSASATARAIKGEDNECDEETPGLNRQASRTINFSSQPVAE